MPCSGRCGERHCPTCCLCCEVFCCFGPSVSSTRYIIQDEFNIKTTGCDNCIIGCMVCLQQVACICNILACLTGSGEINDIAECLSCIAESVYCSVCACMQTQHNIELNKRDGKFDTTPQPVMAAPQAQQMSRSVDASAPSQGSPPPMAYQPPPMAYPHQPPAYMHPPAYGQPMNPHGGHDPYAPVAYHGQHPQYPPQMYHPHAPYIPGHLPGAYPAGPPSGYQPPSAPLAPHGEHLETEHPSSNPPK
ncbi:hypothetical protein ACLB2K_074256 [Fragaria x ananassa]